MPNKEKSLGSALGGDTNAFGVVSGRTSDVETRKEKSAKSIYPLKMLWDECDGSIKNDLLVNC